MTRPTVYAGGGCSRVGLARLHELGWGQVHSEGPWRKLDTPRWVFDNGAWDAFQNGQPFPAEQFARRIDRCIRRGFKPDFIVLPDCVGDFARTLALSEEWTPRIPTDWPRYLALQNGADARSVADFVARNQVDGLFLGGDDDFKDTQASRWADRARALRLRFHFARAGTPRKFELALLIRAHSLDSSRLSRSWRDFRACRDLWERGPAPRLFPEPQHRRPPNEPFASLVCAIRKTSAWMAFPRGHKMWNVSRRKKVVCRLR